MERDFNLVKREKHFYRVVFEGVGPSIENVGDDLFDKSVLYDGGKSKEYDPDEKIYYDGGGV